jgi:hypothetical protein
VVSGGVGAGASRKHVLQLKPTPPPGPSPEGAASIIGSSFGSGSSLGLCSGGKPRALNPKP